MTSIDHRPILLLRARPDCNVAHWCRVPESWVSVQQSHTNIWGTPLLASTSDHPVRYDEQQLPMVAVRGRGDGIQGGPEGFFSL